MCILIANNLFANKFMHIIWYSDSLCERGDAFANEAKASDSDGRINDHIYKRKHNIG